MGSISFDGVRFPFYTDDHIPPHVHGFYAGVEVIVELGDSRVQRARRKHSIRPANAKLSDVAHILSTAAIYRYELTGL